MDSSAKESNPEPSKVYRLAREMDLPKPFRETARMSVTPSGSILFFGGEEASLGIMRLDNDSSSIRFAMPPRENYTRMAPAVYFDENSTPEDIDSQFKSGYMVTGVPYTSSIGSVDVMDCSETLDGSVDMVACGTQNGFLVIWRKSSNNALVPSLIHTVQTPIGFISKIKILTKRHIAISDFLSGIFNIFKVEDNTLTKIEEISLPKPGKENKIHRICAFDFREEGNTHRLVLGDLGGSITEFILEEEEGRYLVSRPDVCPNPTKKRYEELDHDEKEKRERGENVDWTRKYKDPGVVSFIIESIAQSDENTRAIGYQNGILYQSRNENGGWDSEVVKFGDEEMLPLDYGGCGSIRKLAFLENGSIAVLYKYGRVAVWSKNMRKWEAEIIRREDSDTDNDMVVQNNRILVSANYGEGKRVEIYEAIIPQKENDAPMEV